MIRQIENFETEKVMDIWLKTTITAHSFLPEKYWMDNYSVVKDEYLPNSTTFIYKEDSIIKAFISIMNNSFIGALFVIEEYQRQGIGRKLIDYCKSIYSRLELAVYVENQSAVNAYKHCGFEVNKEQLNEDSGHLEYIMTWTKEEDARYTK